MRINLNAAPCRRLSRRDLPGGTARSAYPATAASACPRNAAFARPRRTAPVRPCDAVVARPLSAAPVRPCDAVVARPLSAAPACPRKAASVVARGAASALTRGAVFGAVVLSLGWAMPLTGQAQPSPFRAAGCAGGEALERSVYAMGTTLRLRIEGSAASCGEAALEAAVREVERLEGVLSSWRADSEIGVLNAAPAGARMQLTRELATLLAESEALVRATGGAFDPAVGALIDAWDTRGAGRVASPAALARARAAAGWSKLALGRDTLVRGPTGWWLDTGAFGKGAALRAAEQILRAHGIGRATLDFGGQLLVLGAGEVAVAHPAKRTESAAALHVRDVSVSTTSSSERFVDVDGVRLGHVLDPRTGRPVPAWGSVTVVAADALEADALSTALFVMGPDAAMEWARARRDVAVLVLFERDGALHARTNEALDAVLSWTAAREPRAVRPSFDGSQRTGRGR